ncbi:hypothetical protein FRC03_001245 [Tulasnella sp. 419]|nr:hypothetical protein FRC03_001245 [Tulasnella sp. 419]
MGADFPICPLETISISTEYGANILPHLFDMQYHRPPPSQSQSFSPHLGGLTSTLSLTSSPDLIVSPQDLVPLGGSHARFSSYPSPPPPYYPWYYSQHHPTSLGAGKNITQSRSPGDVTAYQLSGDH